MHASLNRSNSISECTVHTHTFDFCVWVLCSFFPVREISMFLAWGWCEAFCSSLSHSNCNVCRIQVFRPVNVFHCAVINQIESLPTHLFKYRNVDAFIHIYIWDFRKLPHLSLNSAVMFNFTERARFMLVFNFQWYIYTVFISFWKGVQAQHARMFQAQAEIKWDKSQLERNRDIILSLIYKLRTCELDRQINAHISFWK